MLFHVTDAHSAAVPPVAPATSSFAIRQIEFVGPDLAELRDLFVKRLCFSEIEGEGGTRILVNGSAVLRLATADSASASPDNDEHAFVTRHDTAIRELGFTVPDVARAVADVRKAGGRIIRDLDDAGTAVVEIYPGLQHSLHAADDEASEHAAQSGGGFNVVAIDHVAICLPEHDFTEVTERYRKAFGLHVSHEEYVATGVSAMNSVVLTDGAEQTKLVFMQPRDGVKKSQIQVFIDNHGGAGIQHVAFQVKDIVAAALWLKSREINLLPVPESYYGELSQRLTDLPHAIDVLRDAQVLVDEDSSGQLLQAFTKPLFTRNTVFLELVERRGSTGFGSGNIKALFKAVEREMAEAANAAAAAAAE
jgi:4-hydroxymandelate synthase